MPLHNPVQNSKVWFSNFGNTNNVHLIDPPRDSDCMLHIIHYLAKSNGWNDIPLDPDHLKHAVSNKLKHPSNGAEH